MKIHFRISFPLDLSFLRYGLDVKASTFHLKAYSFRGKIHYVRMSSNGTIWYLNSKIFWKYNSIYFFGDIYRLWFYQNIFSYLSGTKFSEFHKGRVSRFYFKPWQSHALRHRKMAKMLYLWATKVFLNNRMVLM